MVNRRSFSSLIGKSSLQAVAFRPSRARRTGKREKFFVFVISPSSRDDSRLVNTRNSPAIWFRPKTNKLLRTLMTNWRQWNSFCTTSLLMTRISLKKVGDEISLAVRIIEKEIRHSAFRFGLNFPSDSSNDTRILFFLLLLWIEFKMFKCLSFFLS